MVNKVKNRKPKRCLILLSALLTGLAINVTFAQNKTDCDKLQDGAQRQQCLDEAALEKARASFMSKYQTATEQQSAPGASNASSSTNASANAKVSSAITPATATPTAGMPSTGQPSGFSKPLRKLPQTPAQAIGKMQYDASRTNQTTKTNNAGASGEQRQWWTFDKSGQPSAATYDANSPQAGQNLNASNTDSHISIYH